jgi:hypothetical protein
MAISRRTLRFRFRLGFGFGLAAALVVLMLVPTAYGARPRPKPVTPTTAAGDQYKPGTSVTLIAARIGKCKLAVTRLYAVRKKRCKGKACRIVAKAELVAKRKCDLLGQTTPKATTKP